MQFNQNNNYGENLIIIKGDTSINNPEVKIQTITVKNKEYVPKSIPEKILLYSSLVVNAILLYQFIKSII